MNTVTSKDGTIIGYDRLSRQPAIVLVGGGSVDRWSNAPLAELLAERLTVYNYDRRGRGISGDAETYAVEREIEDIAAMLEAAGGSAALYGSSSGAALALEAAASGLPVTKLVLWEPPYIVPGDRPPPPADQAQRYRALVAAGRRGDAVEFFMSKVVGLPAEFVAQARKEPWWPAQEALAHTLAYDATIMGDYTIPADKARAVQAPTLVLSGEKSPDWMRHSNQELASLLPNGRHHILEGQEHNVAPEVIAPVILQFVSAEESPPAERAARA